ncbi:hypothetical protein AgCh_000007 [Apium graveolens]
MQKLCTAVDWPTWSLEEVNNKARKQFKGLFGRKPGEISEARNVNKSDQTAHCKLEPVVGNVIKVLLETTLKEYWVLHFDGASKTKSSGAGLVLQNPDGFMIEYALKLDFPTTNNEAEYEALIAGLDLAKAVRVKNLKVCGDSRFVVAQVNGEFEAEDDTMTKYMRVVKGILTRFDEWYAEHVPREENTMANVLSQFSSSEIKNYPRSIYFQVLKTLTIHVINLIAPVGVASCWIDPINTHLETGWLPDDAQEAHKLSVIALRYSLIEGLLYKRSFVILYLKCLRPLEADEALKEAREGICGQHLGGRTLAHKITRLGFYWPTMLADAKAYVKRCDRCQMHAPIVRQPAERLTSISTPIPFAMWGMDILGPFSMASGQRKFIVVAIDERFLAHKRNEKCKFKS